MPVAQEPQRLAALLGEVNPRELTLEQEVGMSEPSRRSFFCLYSASRLLSAASPSTTRWPRPLMNSTNQEL